MTDYINRQAAITLMTNLEVNNPHYTMTEVKRVLANIPSANVETVAYCKDCRYRGTIICPMVHETLGNGLVDYAIDEGFCYMGRRKGG